MTDQSRHQVQQIVTKLLRFVSGEDRSIRFAGEIGADLDEVFGEDERFEELVLALASYQPGGGEFLYDEVRILPLCKWVLRELEAELASAMQGHKKDEIDGGGLPSGEA